MTIDLLGGQGLSTLGLLETLGRSHFNEVLAAGSDLGSLASQNGACLLGRSVLRRRHEVPRIQWLSKPRYDSNLTCHLLLHELVELVDRHMFELTILTLAHKPAEYFFVRILLALLVSEVEGVAGLLVKRCQSVGGVDEAVLQAVQMCF